MSVDDLDPDERAESIQKRLSLGEKIAGTEIAWLLNERKAWFDQAANLERYNSEIELDLDQATARANVAEHDRESIALMFDDMEARWREARAKVNRYEKPYRVQPPSGSLRPMQAADEADAQRGADAWAAVAVAWDAGYRAGCEDEKRDRGPVGGEGGPSTRNPYLTYDEWGNPSLPIKVTT